ncbi:hypothetical protein [Qipengyuania sp. ASV99]|uniref:hypothetical protein n=1 Tax=Qipengyuania sp. ASV99 TaxID=3399681 RepID=UPI003A4C7F8D
MPIDTALLKQVEKLLPNSVREDFLEHYSDWAEISSLMVDIKWEIMFIDLAGLDQVIALYDVKSAARSNSDPAHPLWKIDNEIERLGPDAQDLAAKILQFHVWQDARARSGKASLSQVDYNQWMSRQERPYLDWKSRSSQTSVALQENCGVDPALRNDLIADFVIERYPEEMAYLAADISVDYWNGSYGRPRSLSAPGRRISDAALYLFGSYHDQLWTEIWDVIRDKMQSNSTNDVCGP